MAMPSRVTALSSPFRAGLVTLWLLTLSGCAPTLALVGMQQVEQVARRQCEQMPSMAQRNQCLRDVDKSTPADMRPRQPLGGSPQPDAAEQLERERRQQEALCIRREGQAPWCPN